MTWIIALTLAPLAILTLSFAAELFVGLRPLVQEDGLLAPRGRTIIIVPAHNEEAIIASSLGALKDAASGKAGILLIADNCTDRTADIAMRLGVEVVERADPTRRGKGFALDFARSHLAADPPERVIIVDADCAMSAAGIGRLIAACDESSRPCQAIYVQNPELDSAPTLQISTFAFYIKNVVRQRALQRLAGRVHLVGTGMALPWRLFEDAELASDNIVEDLELGLTLAERGFPALLVEAAEVRSDPASKQSTIEQRRRWEGGYLQSAANWGPRVVGRGIRYGDRRWLWVGLSLFIPPLAMLVSLDLAAILVAALSHWLFGSALWPLWFMTGAMALASLGIFLAWLHGGSRFVTLGALLRIPLYLFWKIPIYLRIARRGAPKEWVRTERGS